VLTDQAIQYPFTHDILLLIELLRVNSIDCPTDAADLALLTPFAAGGGTMIRFRNPLALSPAGCSNALRRL